MDLTQEATEVWAKLPKFSEGLATVANFTATHNNEVAIAMMGLLVLIGFGMLIFSLRSGKRPKERRRGRTLSQRIKGIKLRIAADLITNAVEEGVHQGLFTKKNATWLYRELGSAAGLADLFPKRQERIELRKQKLRAKLGLGPNDELPSTRRSRKNKSFVEETNG